MLGFTSSYLILVEDYSGFAFTRQQIACGHADDFGADDADIRIEFFPNEYANCSFVVAVLTDTFSLEVEEYPIRILTFFGFRMLVSRATTCPQDAPRRLQARRPAFRDFLPASLRPACVFVSPWF